MTIKSWRGLYSAGMYSSPFFISHELNLREFSSEGSLFVRMPHNWPHFIIPLKKRAKTSRSRTTTPKVAYFVGRRSRSESKGVSIDISDHSEATFVDIPVYIRTYLNSKKSVESPLRQGSIEYRPLLALSSLFPHLRPFSKIRTNIHIPLTEKTMACSWLFYNKVQWSQYMPPGMTLKHLYSVYKGHLFILCYLRINTAYFPIIY